jgi:hypothetical protein
MRARMGVNAAELIAAHEAAGRRFNAAGVQSQRAPQIVAVNCDLHFNLLLPGLSGPG